MYKYCMNGLEQVPVAWKCNDVVDDGQLFAFAVKGSEKEYVFATSNTEELQGWMHAFACVTNAEVRLVLVVKF